MDNGREDKNPWDKWSWADYEAETGLRACSLAAQGLWMRMLRIMAHSKIKGFLLDDVNAMDIKVLSNIVGRVEEEVLPLVKELGDRGVYSKTIDGVIYNRRMARQGMLSRKRSNAGRKGMEERWGDNKQDSKPITAPQMQCITPSVSVYSSILSDIDKEGSVRGEAEVDEVFEPWWAKYPRKLGKQDARKEFVKIIRQTDPGDLHKALDNYLGDIASKGTEDQYIKHPTTFLRADRWRDYLNITPSKTKNPMPKWALDALERQRKGKA